MSVSPRPTTSSSKARRDHVAIMTPSWRLIPKIVSGEKTIESRWYQTRRAPWNGIDVGDRVFFKDSGKPVTAVAVVSEAIQFTLETLDEARAVVEKFGREICLVNADPGTWDRKPRFCVLIRLVDARLLDKPFFINKTGFGAGVAWVTVPNINAIKL